jgi:mevalonate kinase
MTEGLLNPVGTGFAPGKVIVLGEHAVVYGHAALCSALTVGVTAEAKRANTTRVEIAEHLKKSEQHLLRQAVRQGIAAARAPSVHLMLQSSLPVGLGLGSSGALSVAVARALWSLTQRSAPSTVQILKVALAMETAFHGTPSGVDHHTSALGGTVIFQRGRTRPLRSKRPLQLLVLLVGQRPATKVTVAALRERQRRWPKRYQHIFSSIGALAKEGAEAVERGDGLWLGDLMNMNQGLLSALQLSGPRIDEAVHALRKKGALGAKLTGAGGDGGAVIGLFENVNPARRFFERQGYRCLTATL